MRSLSPQPSPGAPATRSLQLGQRPHPALAPPCPLSTRSLSERRAGEAAPIGRRPRPSARGGAEEKATVEQGGRVRGGRRRRLGRPRPAAGGDGGDLRAGATSGLAPLPVLRPVPRCPHAPRRPVSPRARVAAVPALVGEPPSAFRSHVRVHGHGGHRAHSPSRAPTRGGGPGRGRGGGARRDGAAARGVPGRAKFQRPQQHGGDSLLLSSPALTTILLVQEMTWKTEESGVWGRRGPPNSGGRSRASPSPASPEPAPRGSSRVPVARPTGRATLRRRSGLRQLCARDTFGGSCWKVVAFAQAHPRVLTGSAQLRCCRSGTQ